MQNFNMNIPGLKDVEITKVEEIGDRIALYVQLPKCTHQCLDTFPVHPYIEGIENRDTIKKIYNEWYKRLKKSNTVHFVDPQKHQIEVDWRYSFEYIVKTVRRTLDYLDWLSKDDIWISCR